MLPKPMIDATRGTLGINVIDRAAAIGSAESTRTVRTLRRPPRTLDVVTEIPTLRTAKGGWERALTFIPRESACP